MTRRDRWEKRPCVQRYWAFKDAIRQTAEQQGFVLGESFEIIFGIPEPKSWSKKKKNDMLHEPHRQKPDLDNLIKSVQDALLQEDSGVWAIIAQKIWSSEPKIQIKNLSV